MNTSFLAKIPDNIKVSLSGGVFFGFGAIIHQHLYNQPLMQSVSSWWVQFLITAVAWWINLWIYEAVKNGVAHTWTKELTSKVTASIAAALFTFWSTGYVQDMKWSQNPFELAGIYAMFTLFATPSMYQRFLDRKKK